MSNMLEETRQQPETLRRTLERGLRDIRSLELRLKKDPPRLVVIAARGTSDNAAQFGRYLIEITTGIPVSLAAPSIATLYKRGGDRRGVLVIGISQSGESTDTNAVLADGRERGATTLGITNEPASTMAKTAEYTLLVRAGKEKSVAATKTYTGQLMALYLLAAALGGGVRAEQLRQIPDRVDAVLRREAAIAETTERYRFMNGTVIVGRGLNYANALEFGLKLMETCYVLAERFSGADLLHGPIAMVERGFPVFVFAPGGPTWPSISAVLRQLNELKADMLVITGRGNKHARGLGRTIELPPLPAAPGIPDLYTPIPYIIPAQLFAAHLARIKGFDPDRPRTLSKITRTM
ncbi:MAG: SIS domain-containing protein [Bryobacterales bacterium]|nr:SIS domain-containing protein [Bryobacterales bacterium]MBV9399243.1 SIS domain-containing protein [Bryobacterales bacterium]